VKFTPGGAEDPLGRDGFREEVVIVGEGNVAGLDHFA